MSMKLRHLAVVLPLAATLGACGPENLQDESTGSTGSQETPSATEPAMGTASQELSSVGAYGWGTGATATPMGSSADRACFLTRIQGIFTSGSTAEVFSTSGSWYLRGAGNTSAGARCAGLPAGSSYSGEYTWRAGQRLPTNLGSASGRVCFLVRVTGSFNSASDWVRVYKSGDSWFLFGDSQLGDGLAQARCVTVGTYSGEHTWNSSQGYSLLVGTTSGQVCGLTYMAGQFATPSDYIGLSNSSGSWYLGGHASNAPVYARARCF